MATRRMAGKVCIITGASSSTGPALARLFAAEGGTVVVVADRAEFLQELLDEVNTFDEEGLAVVGDVTVYNQIRNVVDRTVETFGRVDVMVNNAGSVIQKTVEDTTPQEIDDQIENRVKSVIYGSKAVLGIMKDHGAGHIVNIGAQAPAEGSPTNAMHAAATHAVLGFSLALDNEVRSDGIRVNVLSPPTVRAELCGDFENAELLRVPEELISADDIAELAVATIARPTDGARRVVIWPSPRPTGADIHKGAKR